MINVCVVICYYLELLVLFVFCNKLMEKKYSSIKTLAIGAVLFLVNVINYFLFKSIVLNLILTIITYFLFQVICYKDKLVKKIINSILLLVLSDVSEQLTINIHLFDYNPESVLARGDEPLTILYSISSKLLFFILAFLFSFVVGRKNTYDNKKYLLLFTVPMFSLANQFYDYYIFAKYPNIDTTVKMVLIFIGTGLVIISLVIFVCYQAFDDNDIKLRELEKEQQFVRLNDSYMKVLEYQNNEMRMIVHDTKNHYNAIANMDDTAEIKEYIDSIFDDIEKYQIIKLTNNRMLDLLLSKYKVICNDKRITLDLEVKTANLDYIDNTDLSIIVSNLMDNAISACEKSKDRYINLCIRKVNSFDVLTVSNTCDEKPNISGKRIITSKSDKQSHGHGMKIISKYAKKNNAEYEWHYDETEHTFCSTLMFNR